MLGIDHQCRCQGYPSDELERLQSRDHKLNMLRLIHPDFMHAVFKAFATLLRGAKTSVFIQVCFDLAFVAQDCHTAVASLFH